MLKKIINSLSADEKKYIVNKINKFIDFKENYITRDNIILLMLLIITFTVSYLALVLVAIIVS